jgi:twitching motility protein PilJ
MEEMLRVNERTSDGTRQTADSVRQLADLAQELKSSVSGFRVA